MPRAPRENTGEQHSDASHAGDDAGDRAGDGSWPEEEGPRESPQFEAISPYGARDERRGPAVYIYGRDSVIHMQGGEENVQAGRLFTTTGGRRARSLRMREDADGFRQIAADFRAGFFAAGCDEVRFAAGEVGHRYKVYHRE